MPLYGAIALRDLPFTLTLWKNAVGAPLEDGEFEFTLYDEDNAGAVVDTARNDANGHIVFPLEFTQDGEYHFAVAETTSPAPEGWVIDGAAYPVVVTVVDEGDGVLSATAAYPNGLPGFVNTLEPENGPCGLIQFPVTFDAPGVYEYTLRETTGPGGNWTTDDTEYPVIVTVDDDGSGNLVASIEYPEGFPEFVNRYELVFVPVQVILSATKVTIGAAIGCDMFEFGLFDEEGELIATATNGPSA